MLAFSLFDSFPKKMENLSKNASGIFKSDVINSSELKNVSLNISEEEADQYLRELQEQTNIVFIPVFIYLFFLSVFGFFGNSLILLVYSRKSRKTATIVLIKSIAIWDLITNIVVIPAAIYGLFHTWNYPYPYLCKGYIYLNGVTGAAPATLLLALAFVRYLKICRPFGWQVSSTHAQVICVTVAVLSTVISIPYGVSHGRQRRETPRPGVYGQLCNLDEKYTDTIWPAFANGFFLAIFIACCVPLCVFYTLIGLTARKHRKPHDPPLPQNGINFQDDSHSENSGVKFLEFRKVKLIPTKLAELELEVETSDVKPNGSVTDETSDVTISTEFSGVNNSVVSISKPKIRLDKKKEAKRPKRKAKSNTTRMLLIISVVYIATNLATLLMYLARAITDETIVDLGQVGESFYKLFMMIHLVNCAVNPVIYSLCDRNFRLQCRQILRRSSNI